MFKELVYSCSYFVLLSKALLQNGDLSLMLVREIECVVQLMVILCFDTHCSHHPVLRLWVQIVIVHMQRNHYFVLLQAKHYWFDMIFQVQA